MKLLDTTQGAYFLTLDFVPLPPSTAHYYIKSGRVTLYLAPLTLSTSLGFIGA
jgi:hypothetical protein